jgi:hypothetical protein
VVAKTEQISSALSKQKKQKPGLVAAIIRKIRRQHQRPASYNKNDSCSGQTRNWTLKTTPTLRYSAQEQAFYENENARAIHCIDARSGRRKHDSNEKRLAWADKIEQEPDRSHEHTILCEMVKTGHHWRRKNLDRSHEKN